jgi:hypothetical protein
MYHWKLENSRNLQERKRYLLKKIFGGKNSTNEPSTGFPDLACIVPFQRKLIHRVFGIANCVVIMPSDVF